VVHNIALNRSENLPSYPPINTAQMKSIGGEGIHTETLRQQLTLTHSLQ